ncbi:non-specific lipid transfer protein GPI-anchored 5-like [Salvia splendens]|uniref:non-specific lipid transfer protein GPI-anchored 5-like n=1 Tax=Salvia splendens TaxID=180675 RepID=UPI0010FFDAD1|nr:non-specific lipid transfer protein GPI-anchored 5-like [Salvia splendens]
MAKLQFQMISIIVVAFVALAAAQSDDCTNVVVSMSPCLNYGNSSAAPTAACCTQLNTVAHSRPQCLCQVFNGGGLTVDQSQAQALPTACNVQTPHLSNCKGGGSSSPGNGSSDASATSFGFNRFFFILLVFATYTYTF